MPQYCRETTRVKKSPLISLTWKLFSRVIGGIFPGGGTVLPEWQWGCTKSPLHTLSFSSGL
ncbi:hypothetical protein LEMLEM_LOCUS21551, partial [Lemmus lemmus]